MMLFDLDWRKLYNWDWSLCS